MAQNSKRTSTALIEAAAVPTCAGMSSSGGGTSSNSGAISPSGSGISSSSELSSSGGLSSRDGLSSRGAGIPPAFPQGGAGPSPTSATFSSAAGTSSLTAAASSPSVGG